jgi:hypothetical protein
VSQPRHVLPSQGFTRLESAVLSNLRWKHGCGIHEQEYWVDVSEHAPLPSRSAIIQRMKMPPQLGIVGFLSALHLRLNFIICLAHRHRQLLT